MRSLIPHMRLLTFTPSVAAHLCSCLILNDEERAAILEFTITQEVPKKFPSTLCSLTTPRLFPFRELHEMLIPSFLTIIPKQINDPSIADTVKFTSNSYSIVNSVTLSPKRNIYLTGLSGLGLMKTSQGIEFNSQKGFYEVSKDSNPTFSCSVTVKGLGQEANWNLQNVPHDNYWTVRLQQPILLKKSAGEYSVTVHFRPMNMNSGSNYYMKNVSEDKVNEAIAKSVNNDIFNSLNVTWTLDYHSGRGFGPNGPIFLKNFSYVIDPNNDHIKN